MERRTLLSLVALAAITPKPAEALRRPEYGGSLRLVLPFDVTRLDPHDPSDLCAALLGPNLFEPLYGLTSRGVPYSTLAQSLPRSGPSGVEVALRPGLIFSDGSPLDAPAVAASLERGLKHFNPAKSLGKIAFRGKETLLFTNKDPNEVARLLCSPRMAIVPKQFSSSLPVGAGPLRATRNGSTLVLLRNPSAPRGGSYLDEVRIERGDLRACLRAFEAGTSEVGLLGAGLYQTRKGASAFHLASPGIVLLRPGRGVASFARPGVLNDALSRLPREALEALGIERTSGPKAPWAGPSAEILVPEDEPWLVGIAKELESAWTSAGAEIRIKSLGRREVEVRTRAADFDLTVSFLRTDAMSDRELVELLFSLEGKAAPRGGRTLSIYEAARQLNLGIVGRLRPHGYVNNEFERLTSVTDFDLGNASRSSAYRAGAS